MKLDRLLDTKYTPEELKKMLNQYKVGDEVQLTKECLEWIKNHSYYMHIIGIKETDGVLTRKNAEGGFFIDMYMANNFPYKAIITEFLSDVGDKLPGARLRIVLPNGIEKMMIQSVLDFY